MQYHAFYDDACAKLYWSLVSGRTGRKKLNLGPVYQRFWISGVKISFISSQRRESQPWNFSILLVFHALKKQDSNLRTSISSPKRSREFRGTGPCSWAVVARISLSSTLIMSGEFAQAQWFFRNARLIGKIGAVALACKIYIFCECAVAEQRKSVIISFVIFCLKRFEFSFFFLDLDLANIPILRATAGP